MRKLLTLSLVLLFLVEISQIYFIMPFPGSQKMNTINLAYWIHNNILWIRSVLLIALVVSLVRVFPEAKKVGKVVISIFLILYGYIFYKVNFRFQADKMFLQPKSVVFKNSSENTVDAKRLVLGVEINGEAKAYPIQVIGYHHQVRDSIAGQPVMITYCTVCRTGRVFSPKVNGKLEDFRLVGMDHFNAMFEDATTKTWWQQATGEAIVGDLKGSRLDEIHADQSSLGMWVSKHPNTLILQPDTTFNKRYKSLDKFDDGTTPDDLEKRDSSSWKEKSWVIGIDQNNSARAYDWNMLVEKRVIEDVVGELPVIITLENDTASFNVLSRKVRSEVLSFKPQPAFNNLMNDTNTNSTWTYSGLCIDGVMKGSRLNKVRASQEFWHSWRTFHVGTTKF